MRHLFRAVSQLSSGVSFFHLYNKHEFLSRQHKSSLSPDKFLHDVLDLNRQRKQLNANPLHDFLIFSKERFYLKNDSLVYKLKLHKVKFNGINPTKRELCLLLEHYNFFEQIRFVCKPAIKGRRIYEWSYFSV